MGQCVSRSNRGPYALIRHHDSGSLASSIHYSHHNAWRGHSESKGAKKKNGGVKASKGIATSFGFRRRPASSSRADDNLRCQPLDTNGNGGSTEDLYACNTDALSGRSTPLARPRKESAGVPLRTNRFGFRQPTISKTAKVGDVNLAAEQAFNVTSKDKECKFNNNAIDKISTNAQNLHLTQVSATEATTIVGASGVPKTVTKQTVILTYQAQQVPAGNTRNRSVVARNDTNGYGQRSQSASRAYTSSYDTQKAVGKYTFQTNQLPRPQYPAVKVFDTKSAKQVVNSSRKVSGSSDGSSREGSATDSGVSTTGDYYTSGGESPRMQRRRPRNLEMVMKSAHSFHLRELNVHDLDIMDEAVVTDDAVIPLPKLPSTFDSELDLPKLPTYTVPAALTIQRPAVDVTDNAAQEHSPMSTLDRYRTRTRERTCRFQPSAEWKDEEKFVLDRAQPERLNKQNSFIKCVSSLESPATVDSSKESSPSCKSEESQFDPHTEPWHNDAAGEAMATRSQDDVSLAFSTSSVEEDRSKKSPHDIPQKTIIIMDDNTAPHPMLMKSLTISQHDALRSMMMNSMTSSNYSGLSTSTASDNNVTLTDSKFDLAALEASTQSLIDDETSPADSLISSSSTTDSNNDLENIDREADSLVNIDREIQSLSSSAYQTANTKTKSDESEEAEDAEPKEPEKAGSKNTSPQSPGTPTHASGSLSLSDGRDYFDDEIADQPGLMLRKSNEASPSAKATTESETQKLRKSRERIPSSPQSQKNRKMAGGPAERTPSLDTLSSLASDDMMMEDLGLSVTSLHSVDDYIERLDSSLRSGLHSLDERQLRQELSSSKFCAVKQWNQLLEQNKHLDKQLAAMAHGNHTQSTSSLNSVGASLPVRTARLLQRSRAHTPSSEVGSSAVSDGSASPAPASLLQDVVDIKTLLLQLKRVLHEPGDEHHSKSSETLDPLVLACAESTARGNGRRLPPHTSADSALHPDHTADLKRQILYLQSQVEERDRLVKVLQHQMSKLSDTTDTARYNGSVTEDMCNVATQTDRLRPPVTTNSENSGLVSWNEMNGRKLSTYEAQKTKRLVTNGNGNSVKCICGAARRNELINGEIDYYKNAELKTNSRVGSRYLQAITKEQPKRDLSVNERLKKNTTLYASRSRSIENFHKQNLTERRTENKMNKDMKHHTSYSDLYNGRSREIKINGHSPIQNAPSTESDYSSDGGYKSLPSSINNCNVPKKVSGIPRRSIESRLFAAKPSVKASAI